MANNENKATVEGNLVRNPELKTFRNNTTMSSFCIASDRFYKKGDEFEKETSFFDIQCWGNLAHEVNNNLQKGNAVKVNGRLKQERWIGQDGKANSKIVIVAESIIPVSRNGGAYNEPSGVANQEVSGYATHYPNNRYPANGNRADW